MPFSTVRVCVVGAGIVGAAIACRLSRAGCRVRLFERADRPGDGVTARSFGWVGHTPFSPETTAATFRRRAAALAAHRALDRALDGRLGLAACGALLWERDPAETERLMRHGEAMGAPLRRVGPTAIAERAPALADPPPFALHSAEDCALDAAAAARILAAAAQRAGAELRFGCAVEAVERGPAGAGLVRIGGERVESDIVIVAGGADSARLLRDFAPPAIARSPAILIRLKAACDAPGAPLPILCGPDLEVRTASRGVLIAAGSAPDGADNADPQTLARIGRETLAAARRLLAPLKPERVLSVAVGHRPMTPPDAPAVGRLQAAPAIMVAAAHPGVILAPLIAQAILDDVAGRDAGADPALPIARL